MSRANLLPCTVLTLGLLAAAAWTAAPRSPSTNPPAAGPPTVVVHITSGPTELFQVVSGLRMAADARAMNRRVIVLFSGAGVRVPVRTLPLELRLNDELPLRQMLFDVKDAGARFIVCDASVRALGIFDAEFLDGTFIAHSNVPVLQRAGENAVVFTY